MSKSPPVCELVNSIVESELNDAAAQGVISSVEVFETPVDRRGACKSPSYFVVIRMHWSGDKDWYLTTRRRRDQPRRFPNVGRLLELLRGIGPDPITLHRNVDPLRTDTQSGSRSSHSPAGE